MYQITEKEVIYCGRKYIVYGIKHNEQCYFEDISTDKNKITEFAKKCNKLNLSPIHLKDAAEDFVAEL